MRWTENPDMWARYPLFPPLIERNLMRRKVHYRYKYSDIDLKSDGMFKKERLKNKDKKNFQKQTRIRLKVEAGKQIKGN